MQGGHLGFRSHPWVPQSLTLWLIIIRSVVDYPAMIRRHLSELVLAALADTPAVLINGARQTGKSTLVQSAESGMFGT